MSEKTGNNQDPRPLTPKEIKIAEAMAEIIIGRLQPDADSGEAAKKAWQTQYKALNGKYEALNVENAALRADYDALKSDNAALRSDCDALKSENAVLQARYDDAKAESAVLQAKLGPFEALLDIYGRYDGLETVKTDEEWRKILPTDTPTRFLLCGSRANAITSLWGKMKGVCERRGAISGEDWNAMLDVLRFLLDRYNSTLDSPALELMEDREGAAFNDERHERSQSGSQYSGRVAEVLLPGIWNRKENKAFRKSVVIVGDGPIR